MILIQSGLLRLPLSALALYLPLKCTFLQGKSSSNLITWHHYQGQRCGPENVKQFLDESMGATQLYYSLEILTTRLKGNLIETWAFLIVVYFA